MGWIVINEGYPVDAGPYPTSPDHVPVRWVLTGRRKEISPATRKQREGMGAVVGQCASAGPLSGPSPIEIPERS